MLVDSFGCRRQELTNLAVIAWEWHFPIFMDFVPICFLPFWGRYEESRSFLRTIGFTPAAIEQVAKYLFVEFTAQAWFDVYHGHVAQPCLHMAFR